MRFFSLLALLSTFIFMMQACDDGGDASPTVSVFEVEVTGERFRIRLAGSEQVATAEAALAEGRRGVIQGDLVRGDGGFNAPYSWHLQPSTVTFPDVTMEVCSGRPQSDVEANLDYWVDTLGTYCPWGARIVRRVE